MIIVHFCTDRQLDDLLKAVAKPIEHHGNLDWVAPAWFYVMQAFARSELAKVCTIVDGVIRPIQ